MIDPNLNVRPSVLNLPEKRVAFHVSEKNMSLVMDILSNKLYSDKPLAVIREYLCNGWDACIAAGNGHRLPIVHAPTATEPFFSVRDFGCGLTYEEIASIFVSYGESTKRHSNDFTGMLGIGSKSAFAYTDGFNIVNRDGQYKTTYTAQKTADGGATLAQIGRVECSEDVGLEIVVYVELDDISIFRDKLANFLRFATSKVESNLGMEPVERIFPNPDDQSFFRIKDYRHDAGVLMGNIRYAFDPHQLGYDLPHEAKRFCDSTTFIVPMGSVSFTPSRESIEYTPKTIEFLKKNILAIRERAETYVNQQIAKVDNVIDALELSNLAAEFHFTIGNFKVGQHTVSALQSALRQFSSRVQIKGDRPTRSFKNRHFYNFTKEDVFVFVDNHADMKKRISARAYSARRTGDVYLVEDNPESKIPLADLNLKMVMLSTIPVPKVVRNGTSAPRQRGYVRGLYTLDHDSVSYDDLEEIEGEEKLFLPYDQRRDLSEEILKEAGYDPDLVFIAKPTFVVRNMEGFKLLDYKAAKKAAFEKYAHLSDAIVFARACYDSKTFEKTSGIKMSVVSAVPEFVRSVAVGSEKSNAWTKEYSLRRDLLQFGNNALGRNCYDKREDFVDAILPHVKAFIAGAMQ